MCRMVGRTCMSLGHLDLGQQLVVGIQEGDGPQLAGEGHTLDLWEEPNDLLAKGRCQLSSLQHGVEAVPHGRSNPSENSVVKLITKTIQP